MTPTTSQTRPLFKVIGYVLFAAWIAALLALAYSKVDLFAGWDTVI